MHFRVLLKSNICPNAKLGRFLISNTCFTKKSFKNARFRVKIAYFRDRQTTLSTCPVLGNIYSVKDVCRSRAEGVTRYVEGVLRSRHLASPKKSRSQAIPSCKHDGYLAIGFSRLSYLRVRQTTLSTCPVLGNISKGVTSPDEKPCAVRYATSRARVAGLQEM